MIPVVSSAITMIMKTTVTALHAYGCSRSLCRPALSPIWGAAVRNIGGRALLGAPRCATSVAELWGGKLVAGLSLPTWVDLPPSSPNIRTPRPATKSCLGTIAQGGTGGVFIDVRSDIQARLELEQR